MNLRLRVPGDPWLYAFARALLVTTVHVYGRVCVFGAGNLPASGPAIVVANGVQFRRGFVGPVIERLAAFPIHKGQPDRVALERALSLLADGEVVVLFAEGDLSRRADPTAFRSGVAFLAARSGAPVVPVAIVGAERIWAGGRVHWPWLRLTVGQPISFHGARRGRAAYARMAEGLRDAVIRLHDDRSPHVC